MKKLLCLLLVLCILLSVGCTAPQGGDEPSDTPQDSGSGDASDTILAYTDSEPVIGHYEFERDGVLVGVDFWNLSRPWYGERIEGTITYTNNTGTEISRYLHAFVELGGDWAQDDVVRYSTTPQIEQSEKFATVAEEAPLLLNLLPGETITVNFSVEVPDIQDNDALYNLFFGLYENEVPKGGEVKYLVYFLVHR